MRARSFGSSCLLRNSGPCGHSIMPQERVDLRLAAAEGDERLERGAAAAGGEHLAAELRADLGGEDARLLERAGGVRREHLGPLVAVIARRVAAREDGRELVWKAGVVGGGAR